MVEDNIKEIKWLFSRHGNAYNIGEFNGHEDDTESNYAFDYYQNVSSDEYYGTYNFTFEALSYIPKSDIKDFAVEFSETAMGENLPEDDKELLRWKIQDGGTLDSFISIDYIATG